MGLAYEPAAPPDPGAPGVSGDALPVDDDIVELQGHIVLFCHRAKVCTLRGSSQLPEGHSGHSKCVGKCFGPSEHNQTRLQKQYAIKTIRAGRRPRTDKPFVSPTQVPT